jgi:hypothetical protein
MKGAAKEGPSGFVKGIGKGIGGIVLKPGAGFWGIPGYTMKGVYKEMQKLFGSSVQNYIIAARTAQGFDDYQRASPEERADVVMRWQVLQKNLKKMRNPDELVRDILKEQMGKKESWIEERKAQQNSRPNHQTRENAMANPRSDTLPSHAAAAEEHTLQEVIRLSVLETSHGDATEDARVEQAIRASMAHISHPARLDERESESDEHLQQALHASATEAERHQHEREMHDQDLERALAQSLREHRGLRADRDVLPGPSAPPPPPPPAYAPGHVAGTTQGDFEGRVDRKTDRERDEEMIVLEYIKKQSLLEEENRRRARAEGGGGGGEDGEEGDEELQKALKLSLQQQERGRDGEASGS